MLRMALSYLEWDLVYHKQHAKLKNRADAWQEAVAGTAPLPLLLKDEAVFWTVWLKGAEDHNLNPRPTDGMKEYLAASSNRRSSQRRRLLSALWGLLVLLLVAGAAGVKHGAGATSTRREGAAERQVVEALAAERLAGQRATDAQ